jgi:hypothetical protein
MARFAAGLPISALGVVAKDLWTAVAFISIATACQHPPAWIAIRALVGRNIAQIDLDKGLRIAQSPALLAMGLGLVAVGATLAAPVFANWSYILSVTKNSAAAGGAAAASLLALMGLALVYASREVRLSDARSAA